MFNGLRKRFESLISGKMSVLEDETSEALPEGPGQADEGEDVDALLAARRESRKRESQLILTERIHNRAAGLLNEVRTELLQEIHHRLEHEIPGESLHTLLEVTLDPGFTTRLDEAIDVMATKLFEKLHAEFDGEDKEPLFPSRDGFVHQLATYRDDVLRRHLLEQVEVLALPTSARAFPPENGGGEELKERIGEYWASCRDALDKFFRSVEMVLLDGARDGIRLDSELIRNRLVAAQYRNGYRLLDERFRQLYGEIAELQMSVEPQEDKRAALDRQVVDEIIVPLAYFIRERSEPEPREALAGRAELFREIIDKLVAVPEPLIQTAEAVKPVLRKSVEQARPLVVQDHSYLQTAVESLKPAAIHRTTALLKVLEALVRPELEEKHLDEIEHFIRLNRTQYRLLQQLESHYPELVRRLAPLDRIDDEDAATITEVIDHAAPPSQMVEDLFLVLGYKNWPETLPTEPRRLLRLLASLTLSPRELPAWFSLYQDEPMAPEDRARLARTLCDRLVPGTAGHDERQARLEAVPVPVDLNTALKSIGYRPNDNERLDTFKSEFQEAVERGDDASLAKSIRGVRQLKAAIEQERVSLGATGTDGAPYDVEVWSTDKGVMVGLVLFREPGFGLGPVEIVKRDPGSDNGKELEEKLRKQLQNQALIYQSFHKLFARDGLLSKDGRRSLPSFVKKLYEPTDVNRHLLLSRLRYARELAALLVSFTKQIADGDAGAANDAAAVQQILVGLDRKVSELAQATEKSRNGAELPRFLKEYDRALKYLNTVVTHSINPWLERQTAELATEFEFEKEEVEKAIRHHLSGRGIDWGRDVLSLEAHGIRGTLGCRALMRLGDGSSKVVLLNYHRGHQKWEVRYLGPRITDVVRDALRRKGRSLPNDYDEKHEQPTFSLDEQSCRFFLLKREVARIEATLVLDTTQQDNLWRVVYLRYNDDVLTDRSA